MPLEAACPATGGGTTCSHSFRLSHWTITSCLAACPPRTATPTPSKASSCSTWTATTSQVRRHVYFARAHSAGWAAVASMDVESESTELPLTGLLWQFEQPLTCGSHTECRRLVLGVRLALGCREFTDQLPSHAKEASESMITDCCLSGLCGPTEFSRVSSTSLCRTEQPTRFMKREVEDN